MQNKKILITGGAGYIGSHLCERLRKKNQVTSLDNYFTGKKENHFRKVEYIAGSTHNINEIFQSNRFDYIFHLGEYSRVEQSFDDYELVVKNNIQALSSVMQFARKKQSKLIYSGSSTKFGDIGASSSPYSWSKSINTEHLVNYSRWFDLNFAICYFYNVYGGNEIKDGRYATLIAKYIDAKSKGLRKLPVVKPGIQRRTFTHYKDIVEALILVGLEGQGDGYCIGSEDNFSILEIVKLFKCKPEFIGERQGNRMESQMDGKKMKDLGWTAKNKLTSYISNAIKS